MAQTHHPGCQDKAISRSSAPIARNTNQLQVHQHRFLRMAKSSEVINGKTGWPRLNVLRGQNMTGNSDSRPSHVTADTSMARDGEVGHPRLYRLNAASSSGRPRLNILSRSNAVEDSLAEITNPCNTVISVRKDDASQNGRSCQLTTDNEVWKSLANQGFPSHEVSSLGRVKHAKLDRILFGTARHGYAIVCLSLPGDKNKVRKVHVLVATAFLPNPENKLTVNHINEDKLDNRLVNLEWATHSEQMLHRSPTKRPVGRRIYQFTLDGRPVRQWPSATQASEHYNLDRGVVLRACKTGRECGGYLWKAPEEVEVIPDEVWKEVPYPDLEPLLASSYGRIMRGHTRQFVNQAVITEYWTISSTRSTGEHTMQLVHRLVAAAFFGASDLFVNHKDCDKLNNRVGNLEYVTNQGNITHAKNNGRLRNIQKHRIPVVKYSLDGVKLNEYDSITEAASANRCNKNSVANACKKKWSTPGGFFWRYPGDQCFAESGADVK